MSLQPSPDWLHTYSHLEHKFCIHFDITQALNFGQYYARSSIWLSWSWKLRLSFIKRFLLFFTLLLDIDVLHPLLVSYEGAKISHEAFAKLLVLVNILDYLTHETLQVIIVVHRNFLLTFLSMVAYPKVLCLFLQWDKPIHPSPRSTPFSSML